MREILFRGKRIDTREWVEGFYLTSPEFDNNGLAVITTDNPRQAHYVHKETVGQFTGLTDNNRKKIFEGDIVKREFTLWRSETNRIREAQIGVVVYSNTDCNFQVEKKCNLRKPWQGDTIEVIGNIHDNPELLERSENGT